MTKRGTSIVKLNGFNLSPALYAGHPVFVIDGVRYYMASKHKTAQAAKEGADGRPVIGKYLTWYLRLYQILRKRLYRIPRKRR